MQRSGAERHKATEEVQNFQILSTSPKSSGSRCNFIWKVFKNWPGKGFTRSGELREHSLGPGSSRSTYGKMLKEKAWGHILVAEHVGENNALASVGQGWRGMARAGRGWPGMARAGHR